MIEIVSKFKRKGAVDSGAGSLNNFMQSLIAEVVAENYRQALFEDFLLKERGLDQTLNLALRANERVVSGLFAFGLSKVCALVRPETKTTNENSFGHVDYLAWYNNRVIAIELKAGHIAVGTPVARNDTVQKWETATKQAENAQTFLRKAADEDGKLVKPISLALMVVSGQTNRQSTKKGELSEGLDRFREALKNFSPKPQFVAIYTAPDELRSPIRLRSGSATTDGAQTYTPYYGFIARARING